MDDPIESFLIQATEELLYNIVYDNVEEIGYRELSEEFEEKTGFQPMDFFDFTNVTNYGWFEFLRNTPFFIFDDGYISIDEEEYAVYQTYNSCNLSDGSNTAKYREGLLIKACELISEDDLGKLHWDKDLNGNTALHLIAAMPGCVQDKPTLIEYLLKTEIIPLTVNNDGISILHIIAGRLKAEVDEEGGFHFENQCVKPEIGGYTNREQLLDIIYQELSPEELMSLMSSTDKNGNTVMHKWVLSTVDLSDDEAMFEIQNVAPKLLAFGGKLNVSNEAGLFPLHYAFNSTVCGFLLQNGSSGQARNLEGETPFMFILKNVLGMAFGTNRKFEEIEHFLMKRPEITLKSSIINAQHGLRHLLTSVTKNKEMNDTLWISDTKGVNPLEIVLVYTRIASCSTQSAVLNQPVKSQFRQNLMALLNLIVQAASLKEIRRQNRKGQSVLHVLLDVGSNVIYDENTILQYLQVLLQNGADVNAVDDNGKAVLDIVRKNSKKMPAFFKKCSDILEPWTQKDSGVLPSTTRQLIQATSALNISGSEMKRKLRSCPKHHYRTANQLLISQENFTTVGKYRYFNHMPIGSGAFSSIYVAIKDEHVDQRRATIDCRAIALKRLEKGKINPQEIKREVQALLSISTNCENILNCYECFEDDFFHYISLDLMDGDLQQFVENATAKSMMQRSPETPAKAAQEIINGLVYLHCHKLSYLHRDLKPGNILYTMQPSLHFKIGDFGLAKDVSSMSIMTSTRGTGGAAMAPGTRCWMAPELVSLRSREHTKESDVFALGLVLHFLLTFGKHPFTTAAEEPVYQVEQNIVLNRISIDKSLPKETSNFIEQILAKEPGRRTPVKFLAQHPFLWSEKKKMEFLKAVGDQPEAVNPNNHPDSLLERSLQDTAFGKKLRFLPWNVSFSEMYSEYTNDWKQKKYRTNNVIDLLRFIRNVYAHKEEKSPSVKRQLDDNIFLRTFPSLVLEVFAAVQKVGCEESRSNIRQALTMD